jgi:transposase
MRHAKDKATRLADWIRELLAKKPFRLVSVALANKLARIAWAVLTSGDAYRPQAPTRLNSAASIRNGKGSP